MRKLFSVTLLLVFLSACASMQLEQPQVSVIGFRPVTANGLDAVFELDIQIVNPNGMALPVRGMSYEFAINGTGLLHGVSSQIGDIPAYGKRDVTLQISASLFSAPKILYNLMKDPDQKIHYTFTTKLDLAGVLPTFRLVEDGTIETTHP